MKARLTTLIAAGALVSGGAFANPEAPPWGHAGAPGQPDCTACHFDGEAVKTSPHLDLSAEPGLVVHHDRNHVTSEEGYILVLKFLNADARRAGFQVSARGPDSKPSGTFGPRDGRTEAKDAEIRSTAEGSTPDDPEMMAWTFWWTQPPGFEPGDRVTFYIAANAGNDDQSPLGDTIHLKEVVLRPPGSPPQ